MKRLMAFAVFLLTAVQPAWAARLETVTSPNKAIMVTVQSDNDGRMLYSVTRNGKAVIAPSRLGFILTEGEPIMRGWEIETALLSASDSKWEQPWGERRFVRDAHNELLVTFREVAGAHRHYAVRFRVFDDGVGFRYEFPDQAALKDVRIADELTEFNVAQNGTAWWIPGGDWNRYEYLYNKTAIDAVATAHTPITMKLDDGTYLAFHEAALVDYSAMWFRRIDGTKFRATLSPSASGPRVERLAPFNSPWRTVIVAADPAQLYESNIELNLNEPNKLGDVSWVKPFKYVGVWWEMHLAKTTWGAGPRHGATTENTKRYIDFAAKHGFRGVLVEGWNKGWDDDWFGHGDKFNFTEAYPDFDLKAVADYAHAKGVRIIGHHETGGNIRNYEPQLEDAMALYESLGIDAVKTGYVADAGGIIATGPDGAERREWHDGQVQSRHHLKVVETAARHHVMVNPHEPIKDTGLRRTYPNWVSREGARGMEYNAWAEPLNPPSHEPTLVFTRMLAGPMDFTPGVLSLEGQKGMHHNSTLARQLGLYVVLYSPIQMAADLPETLEKYPRELAFISQVPTDWAETHVLDAVIGEYVAFARKDRNSKDWYLGGVTDETARSVDLKLDFLDKNKRYVATIYRDGDDADYKTDKRHSIAIETRIVGCGDTLTLRMAAAGGFAVRLAPVKR